MARAKTFQEAEGEENVKKLQRIAADAYLSVESNIFAFSPKMSYVSKEWIGSDPAYWAPKPAKPAVEGKRPAGKTEGKTEAKKGSQTP